MFVDPACFCVLVGPWLCRGVWPSLPTICGGGSVCVLVGIGSVLRFLCVMLVLVVVVTEAIG